MVLKDTQNNIFSKKIRNGATSKTPNVLVVGEQEMSDQTVTWQRYASKDKQTLSFDRFQEIILDEIKRRMDWRNA